MAKQQGKKADKKGVPATAGALGLLRVTAKREGFRRAGRAWGIQPSEVPASDFSEDEISALAEEPMLTVEALNLPAGDPPAGDPPAPPAGDGDNTEKAQE